jgi:uncharacterized membrane protein affecting hemolysin expression
MAHASVNRSALPHTWLPAMLISCVVSLLCAGALYYILAQHDRSLVAHRNAAAIAAVEQSGRAMARTFAWFSESLLNEHLATVQQALEGQAPPTDILDAAVITEETLIVAARNPAGIGRQLQDPGWPAARKNQTGSVSFGLEKGRQALIVVEPLRQQDRIIGWIRLVFPAPQEVAVRSNEDLARDVALAAVPLFVLLATLLILTLRGMMSQVRSLIGGILLEAMAEQHDRVARVAELSEAS